MAGLSAAESSLLRDVIRWMQAEKHIRHGRINRWEFRRPGKPNWDVSFWPCEWEPNDTVALEIRRDRDSSQRYWVRSLVEAVDLLVSLGMVPTRFSSAFRDGRQDGYRTGWRDSLDVCCHTGPGDGHQRARLVIDRWTRAEMGRWPTGVVEECERLDREHPAWYVTYGDGPRAATAWVALLRDETVTVMNGDAARLGEPRRPRVRGATVADLETQIGEVEARIAEQSAGRP
ncbi:hypothetical protein [Actinoplanes rectilineatus]|uniref:hypothetical protein n=1 Tax=Actinoplanes rectilineatus TaxID=113571 RepID=UPI0005F2D861|nr:hypothetical protein [Actinoplanes rectilineatus]